MKQGNGNCGTAGIIMDKKKKFVFVEDVKGNDGRVYGIHLMVYAENLSEARRKLENLGHENVYQERLRR